MHRNTRLAAVLLGMAVSVATSRMMPSISAEAAVEDVHLDADTPIVPLMLEVEARGDVDAADVSQLDIRVSGENASLESDVLSVYVLEQPWSGALPAGSKPVDQLTVRGGLADAPGIVDGTLYTTIDGGEPVHIALVLEGEGSLDLDLQFMAQAWYDELPEGDLSLVVTR